MYALYAMTLSLLIGSTYLEGLEVALLRDFEALRKDEGLQMDKLWSVNDVAKFVDRDLAFLQFYREIFEAFVGELVHNVRLRLGHFFFYAMTAWWFDSLVLALRRQVDTDKRSVSLCTLLQRLVHEIQSGNHYFRVDGLEITVHHIERDLDELAKLSQSAKDLADRTIAHRDHRGPTLNVQSRWDVYWALDAMKPIADLYLNMLLTEGGRATVYYHPAWAKELFAIPIRDPAFTADSWTALAGDALLTTRRGASAFDV
jgi:hypothetical protein